MRFAPFEDGACGADLQAPNVDGPYDLICSDRTWDLGNANTVNGDNSVNGVNLNPISRKNKVAREAADLRSSCILVALLNKVFPAAEALQNGAKSGHTIRSVHKWTSKWMMIS